MIFNIDFFDSIEIKKTFNTVGPCIEEKHYMVNIENKLRKIIKLVQLERYFVINRPRQYGKTTTLNILEKILTTRYGVVKLSFEGIGKVFSNEETFCKYFIDVMKEQLDQDIKDIGSFTELMKIIDEISAKKEIILIIDEVDKASNNELFLEFLGLLRALYIDRENSKVNTFKSVILAGVHDIKNLKIKFREENEVKYNSPWNIAVNFNVDMSFNIEEIATMIEEYNQENKLKVNSKEIAREIYKFTSGYPFLVSRLCQIVDEDLIGEEKEEWTIFHIQKAVKLILLESNTLFDDLIKNLENYKELYEIVKKIILGDSRIIYNQYNPGINLGLMFGYFSKDEENYLKISNLIFSELILDYLTSKVNTDGMGFYNLKREYLMDNGALNIKKILVNFSEFMLSARDRNNQKFLEDDGRLLLSAFIKPIINGTGFLYREIRIEEGKRLDLVIQYGKYKYIIELKLWNGQKYYEEGKKQLIEYLEIEKLDQGYLVIFDFRAKRENKYNEYKIDNKNIFEVFIN